MATPAQWLQGARPRTLPAAVAPVLAGTGAAAWAHAEVWWKAGLALLVALLLQVGVNYANDYSDGVRGTDDARVGPMRLVGSGAASPGAVRAAAFASLGAAAAVGLVLAATTAWWLVAVGALSILAAWFYTGGSRPYGYLGLGEVMVFVFFGLVAVLGTTFVQVHGALLSPDIEYIGIITTGPDASPEPTAVLPPDLGPGPWPAAWLAAIGIGALACAILVANNLRDIPTDTESGKRTLAVVLGARRTRSLYVLLVAVAAVLGLGLALVTTWWALVALIALVPLGRAVAVVVGRATGPALVPVLQLTGVGELLYALGIFAALLLAR